MKLSSLRKLALAFVASIFVSGNLIYADEPAQGSAPTPISPAVLQQSNMDETVTSPTVQHVQPSPLIRDADDPFEGTWDIEVSWRHPLNGDYEALHRALTTVNFMASGAFTYGITWRGGSETWHYECELSSEFVPDYGVQQNSEAAT